jgi:colanic acid/amylovoran biosynthesis protein
MKNILFVNAYSARNLGDFAIVLGMKEVVSQAFGDIKITVSSSYHEGNKQVYPDDLVSVEAVWNISGRGFISRYANGLYLWFLAIVNPRSQKFSSYRQSDVICSVGGGYLYSSVKGPFGIGLLSMLFHIWLGVRFNKKVICFPQSVGPVSSRLDAWILEKVLSKVTLFIAREEKTYRYLTRELGLTHVVESLDVAFSLKPTDSYLGKKDYVQYDSVIGITVLDWQFAIKGSNNEDIAHYLKTIANVFLKISKSQKIKVIIFPQVTVGEGDSDISVSEKLKSLLGDEIAEVFRLPKKLDPQRLMATYGDVDLFIGSRMHSTIFALASCCPTIGLAYQPKTTFTFKLLGLKENVLPIDTFSEKDLLDLIQKVKMDSRVAGNVEVYNQNIIKIITDNAC